MPRLQGLIFDLDGTLVDSAPDLRQAINLMLAAHNRRPLTLDEIKQIVGDGAMILVQRAFALTGEPAPKDVYPLVQQYIGHYRNIKPDPAQIFPHVLEMLERYRSAGVKLGVCTNKQEGATYKLLEELGIRRYFEFIAGGDTFPVHKPHPDHVHGVVTGMDVPATGCVMIGDSTNDVLSAHGCRIPCIVVTQGYGGDFASLGADKLIPDFSALPAALEALGFAP